jgi:2-polyprenyl-3-methyl-5-hydroxy-6-metoxy-1,4-benzoquinol methylase
MDLFLRYRNPNLRELMDDPGCDPVLLGNTYRQFGRINRLLAGWGTVFNRFIRPNCKKGRSYTLLDLGCGGGDLALYISRLSKKTGLDMKIYAADPDERAYRHAIKFNSGSGITFMNKDLDQISAEGMVFDFIISNHLMHHLQDHENIAVMNTASGLCREYVIFNDIHRSMAGYILFGTAIRPLFRNSCIIPDGLTSIKRSYRRNELERIVPEGWRVQTMAPFRLLATYRKSCR